MFKKINNTIYILLSVIALAACHSPKEKALETIKKMEASDSIFSPKAIEDLKTAYLDFATKYPDDELSPEFLFKSAQRCNAIAQHEQAIKIFQSVIDKYPKSKRCEEALFLQGYIYENSLQDLIKAKLVYSDFLQKYPNSELADDAKSAIKNLGKTPEEIMESFKDKNDIKLMGKEDKKEKENSFSKCSVCGARTSNDNPYEGVFCSKACIDRQRRFINGLQHNIILPR